ncbi:MAG: O-antigen ligase family protein [Ignavibacteria bacterium]
MRYEPYVAYLDKFFRPSFFIALIILYAPLSFGDFLFLPINYFQVTMFCLFFVVLLSYHQIPESLAGINKLLLIFILLLTVSFYTSMFFGVDYKGNLTEITIYDSSFRGVFKAVTTFVVMQILLIFFVYNSVEHLNEIKFYINVFLISGVLVNIYLIYELSTAFSGRLGGPFPDYNYLGRFEVFMILTSAILFLDDKEHQLRRVLLGINVLICTVYLFLTLSRSSIITLMIVAPLVYIKHSTRRGKLIYAVIFLALAYLLLMIVTAKRLGSGMYADAGFLTQLLFEPSNITRFIANYAALHMFMDYPIFGVGYHNFYNLYINYDYKIYTFGVAFITVVHSWLFALLAEQGVMGTVPFLYILYTAFKKLNLVIKKTLGEFRTYGLILYSLLSILIIHGLFNHTLFPDVTFGLIFGLIAAHIKLTKEAEGLGT